MRMTDKIITLSSIAFLRGTNQEMTGYLCIGSQLPQGSHPFIETEDTPDVF